MICDTFYQIKSESGQHSDLHLNNGVFPKLNRTFIEFSDFSEFGKSDKSLKMNWAQFKDPASYRCLAGAVVASQSLTQEVAGLSTFNDMFFVPEFSENI